MPLALALVKRDLGSQAVILHTRTYKRGGVFGLGAKTIVEITASDDASVGRGRRQDGSPPPSGGRSGSQRPRRDPAAGDLIRRTYAAAQNQLHQKPRSVRSQEKQEAKPVLAPPAVRAVPDDQLVEEMRSVKRMVGQMLKQQHRRGRPGADGVGSKAKPDFPDQLFQQYLSLLEQQVTEELAEEVIQQVHDSLDPDQHDNETMVRQTVLDVIAKQIPTDGTDGHWEPTADRRPRTVALVGPTGVGKTTTIAKLAATFKLKQKKNVGLITLDTYRIAAVDQLRTYANIIGIPLHVVASGQELANALRRCAGCDVVLIDTAGRSQRDDPRLDQLRSLVEVADPHEVHLVLSSTCAQSVLMEVVERFSTIRVDRIIFTKLDEAVSFGVLLNVARMVNKRLSYVTTGQEVPHQIEPGCPTRLAALVLGSGALC